MSEKKINPAPLWLVVFYTFMLLAFVVATGLATVGELRDLQRRVAELEQKK